MRSTNQISSSKKDKEQPKQLSNISPFTTYSKLNYQSLSALQSILKDSSSLTFYHQAITPTTVANKIVLHLTSDVNCLYSIYAAKAGAKMVYCILNGNNQNQKRNMFMMEQIIKENKLSQKIKVGFWGQFKLQGKVDVLIGQPMGCSMFYDGMIQRMIEARDIYLNQQNGVILPDKIKYKCALVWDQYQKDEKFQYWNQVYGISMKNMKKWVQQQPSIKTVDPTLIISSIQNLLEINLYSITYSQIDDFHKLIAFKSLATQNKQSQNIPKANGLVIWFQVYFTQLDGQSLSIDTSPWCQQSRWTHFTLYTREEWKLVSEEGKKVSIMGKKDYGTGDVRVKIKVDNKQDVFVVL